MTPFCSPRAFRSRSRCPALCVPARACAAPLEFLTAIKRGEKIDGRRPRARRGQHRHRRGTVGQARRRQRRVDRLPPVVRRNARLAGRARRRHPRRHQLPDPHPAAGLPGPTPRGKLTGLHVVRTRLGAPDDSGRRSPEAIEGSEHVIPADLVVEAIGQRAAPQLQAALSGVEFTRQGPGPDNEQVAIDDTRGAYSPPAISSTAARRSYKQWPKASARPARSTAISAPHLPRPTPELTTIR